MLLGSTSTSWKWVAATTTLLLAALTTATTAVAGTGSSTDLGDAAGPYRYPAAFFCNDDWQSGPSETLVVAANPSSDDLVVDVIVRGDRTTTSSRPVGAGGRLSIGCSDLPDGSGASGFVDLRSAEPLDVVATYQTTVTSGAEPATPSTAVAGISVVVQLEREATNDAERAAFGALGLEPWEPKTLLVLAEVPADGLLVPIETATRGLEQRLTDVLVQSGLTGEDAEGEARRIVTEDLRCWVELDETDIAQGGADIAVSIEVVPVAAAPMPAPPDDGGGAGGGEETSAPVTTSGSSDDGDSPVTTDDGTTDDSTAGDDDAIDDAGTSDGDGTPDGDTSDDDNPDDGTSDDGTSDDGTSDDDNPDDGTSGIGSQPPPETDATTPARTTANEPAAAAFSGAVVIDDDDGWLAIWLLLLLLVFILLVLVVVALLFWLTRRRRQGDPPAAPPPSTPPAHPVPVPPPPPPAPPTDPAPAASYDITCAFEGERHIDVDDRAATLRITAILRSSENVVRGACDARLVLSFDFTEQRLTFEGRATGELTFDLPDHATGEPVEQAITVASGAFSSTDLEAPSAEVGTYEFDGTVSSRPDPPVEGLESIETTSTLRFAVAHD
jgi:hypothetical protein